jgi:hypothetical protein
MERIGKRVGRMGERGGRDGRSEMEGEGEMGGE